MVATRAGDVSQPVVSMEEGRIFDQDGAVDGLRLVEPAQLAQFGGDFLLQPNIAWVGCCQLAE